MNLSAVPHQTSAARSDSNLNKQTNKKYSDFFLEKKQNKNKKISLYKIFKIFPPSRSIVGFHHEGEEKKNKKKCQKQRKKNITPKKNLHPQSLLVIFSPLT
jgi:hypothetical protein